MAQPTTIPMFDVPRPPDEQAIRDRIAELHAQVVDRVEQRGLRKGRGVYYTSEPITRYIVAACVGGTLRQREQRLRMEFGLHRSGRKSKAAQEAFWTAWRDRVLKRIRVVDPACGSGAFLLAAFDHLLAEYRRANEALDGLRKGQRSVFDLNRTILARNLFGVDLSAEAAEMTRLSLWLASGEAGHRPPFLDGHIRQGNAVVADPSLDDRAFDWREAFGEVFAGGGFDVVVGNPPYVRHELLDGDVKPYLEQRFAAFAPGSDLYTCFLELGVDVLRAGGVLSYIVTNKWMRARYGEGLRRLLGERTLVEQVVDFGHAPVFADAEVFPCIETVRKPPPAEEGMAAGVCRVEDADAAQADLAGYVRRHNYFVPRARFGADTWSLEHPAVDALLERLREGTVALRKFAGTKPYFGVKTGCNAAFLVDGETRQRLVDEHGSSDELLVPFLRGRDIRRWRPVQQDLWLILARRGIEIERYPAVQRHLEGFRERLEPKPDDWDADANGRWPGRKRGSYRWCELQDTVDYHELFRGPKIVTQDLATYPWFCLDTSGAFAVNTCYIWPTDDPYVLGWMCSPLAWWVMHRTLQHGINDTLRMFRAQVETLPVAEPTPALRQEVVELVGELLALTDLERLHPDPSREKAIQDFEHQLSDRICEAHGLSYNEQQLMWRTAPPRMPIPGPARENGRT